MNEIHEAVEKRKEALEQKNHKAGGVRVWSILAAQRWSCSPPRCW